VLLPIGLSFHVFQSLSYTIEVYRGNQAPERHLGIYAVYVMFWPQLVAGPIERPQNLLPQFHAVQAFDGDRAADGLRRMAWGYFKKVVVADRLALLVNPVFAHPEAYGGLTLVLAAALFSIQIYCDFSGYSDIAVGSAEVMGIRLMENFRRPYFARSIQAFWTRWHVSLSTWFRDYVYIPLGGNRVGKARWSLNLLVVFLLSGLWHGANWTYVLWGALHGGLLVAGIWTRALRERFYAVSGLAKVPALLAAAQGVVVFALVTFAWILFRSPSLAGAATFIGGIPAGLGAHLREPAQAREALLALDGDLVQLKIAAGAIALLILGDALQERGIGRALLRRTPRWLRWTAYVALFWTLILFGVFEDLTFIYFQF
jgi:D-alanyl-lipoteichoic acid acyltransferase DltB (MBOAT superfamily)